MILLNHFHHPPARPLRKRVGAYDQEYPYIPRRRRGKRLHHGGDVCVLVFNSKKPSEREFFVPAGTDLGVKLLRHSDFETRWPNAMEPPGPRQQQHNNQTMDERVGAQVARGDCMGPLTLPPPPHRRQATSRCLAAATALPPPSCRRRRAFALPPPPQLPR